MREDWSRATPTLDLSLSDLTRLIQPAFPGQTVVESTPTQGGLANTNIRLRLSHEAQPILLRLVVRDPTAARREYALNRRVFPHTPVPRFLYCTDENPVTGHPYLLMEWVEGARLEVVAPRLRADQLGELGRSVGAALASIHAITFPQAGFLDAHLNVVTPITPGQTGLMAFLRECLVEGPGGARLGADLTDAVLAFAETEGRLLDTWTGPPCLTHADFGGSNILVRERQDRWEVAAVLDWEFAFSGSPFFDLGNLLRPPLGTLAGLEHAVESGYADAGALLPADWRRLSRLVDLTAWAEFMNRPPRECRPHP